MAKLSDILEKHPGPVDAAVQKALEKSVASMQELLVAVLQSDKRDRFAQAERLAKLANTLQRQSATRVGDLVPGAIEYDDDNNLVNYGVVRPAFNDQGDVLRQMAMQMGPMHASSTSKNLASELRELTDARVNLEGAQRAALDVRIDAIVAQLGKKEETKNDDAHMVSADVLRGHSAQRAGGGDDAGLREAEPVGEGGDAGAARACHERDVGPQALGQHLQLPHPG